MSDPVGAKPTLVVRASSQVASLAAWVEMPRWIRRQAKMWAVYQASKRLVCWVAEGVVYPEGNTATVRYGKGVGGPVGSWTMARIKRIAR
jgi:hypothetical protein